MIITVLYHAYSRSEKTGGPRGAQRLTQTYASAFSPLFLPLRLRFFDPDPAAPSVPESLLSPLLFPLLSPLPEPFPFPLALYVFKTLTALCSSSYFLSSARSLSLSSSSFFSFFSSALFTSGCFGAGAGAAGAGSRSSRIQARRSSVCFVEKKCWFCIVPRRAKKS